MPKLNSCKFARIRTRPTFRDVTTGFPSKCRLQNERRNSIPLTCHYHIWVVFLIGLSKFLPHTTNQKELFLGRYFAAKPVEASRNVGCFLRLKLQPFDQIEGNSRVFCWLASPTITPAKEKTRRNRVKTREEREAKKMKGLYSYILHWPL